MSLSGASWIKVEQIRKGGNRGGGYFFPQRPMSLWEEEATILKISIERRRQEYSRSIWKGICNNTQDQSGEMCV